MADILRQYGTRYLERFGPRLPPSHIRAIRSILACRTAALGGELFSCPDCEKLVYRYHSCRNRACPKCHSAQTSAWLEARRQELVDAPYFHLVVTVPKQLHRLIRSHQRALYHVLLRAAFEALQDLARDPKFLGGDIAALCVLHTWTRTLEYHPHVHMLVPGAGLDQASMLCTARQSFFVPVRALSKRFAGKFIAMARKALPDNTPIPRTPKRWVAFSKPAVDGGEHVLNYLARYVFRHAITNRRILSVDDGHVRFSYKDGRTGRSTAMDLGADEFIRRYLQHVLPARFHKIRYCGLWHPRRLDKLDALRIALQSTRRQSPASPSDHPPDKHLRPLTCPHCGSEHLSFVAKLVPSPSVRTLPPRAPPTPFQDAA